MNVRVLLCAVLLAAVPLCVTGADARERAKPEPEAVQTYDPAKRYVFYLHGLYMDKRGPRGETDYPGIHAALEGMGFVVMDNIRGLLGNEGYAAQVAEEVGALFKAGVPPGHITIAGHSKGGFIALIAASMIQNPKISYAVFGGCAVRGTRYRKRFVRFANGDAENMRGRFVVAWARDDWMAEDCDDAMRNASVTYRNVVLPGGLGPRTYYKPDDVWLDILKEHAGM